MDSRVSPTLRRSTRLVWAVVSIFVVESICFGIAVLPAALFIDWHMGWPLTPTWLRIVILAMAGIPTYAIFAVTFMALSAVSMSLLRWHPPANAEMAIRDLEWPLLNWGRYSTSIHLVRILAGTFFKNTPVWTWYMRMNGARLGDRVFVNSLDVTDHCLLEFGDDVVIGSGVHLSGHSVENGLVKTAPVWLGNGVTIGVGANIEIGVRAGEGCQIGALSAVPKHRTLKAHTTYVGIPARPLERAKEGDKPPREAGGSSG